MYNCLMEVSKGNSWALHQRVKAARIPLEVARAWKMGVLDVSLQKFRRVFCWFKILKLWGAFRSHDAEGGAPGYVDLRRGGRASRRYNQRENNGGSVVEQRLSSSTSARTLGWFPESG